MPNITRGGRMSGLMVYLAGAGRANEHVEPHLVAGDPAIMAWHDDAELNREAAVQIGGQLDAPRRAFGTRVTQPIRDENGEKVGVKDAHVWHCSLSLRTDEEELTDERWAHICEEFVDGMGFTGSADGERSSCRWVAVHHGPSTGGNQHVHIVVGLVAEDGTAARVFGDRRTAQRVAGELEQRHGLQVLASRQSGTAARANKPAETEAAVRARLATVVGQVTAESVSEADFVQRMQNTDGVRIRPRFAAGRDDVITGYSVAEPADSGGPLHFHAAGSLAPALTLPQLRERWPDSPQHATDAVTQWQAAKRNQPPRAASREEVAQPAAMTVPDRLEVTVRACAAGAEDEAGFVQALRHADGVRVRPYFARGGTDTVAGYSVALRDSPAADGSAVWYGGGRLARDLTLPRLRADWPNTPEHTQAALAQWQSAHRNPVAPAIAPPVFDAQAWARCTSEITALTAQLRGVPHEDRDRWAWVARQTAGAFAAWSHQLEGDTPGPLAETARVLGRSAQLHAHQVRPQRAPGPSAGAATRMLAVAVVGGKGGAAQRALMTQLSLTVRALHDAHQAAGDLRRADEIRTVVTARLQHFHNALPVPTPAGAPQTEAEAAASAAEAAEAARLAAQSYEGVRAPGSPVPGRLDVPDTSQPTRPNQRPGVQPSEIER